MQICMVWCDGTAEMESAAQRNCLSSCLWHSSRLSWIDHIKQAVFNFMMLELETTCPSMRSPPWFFPAYGRCGIFSQLEDCQLYSNHSYLCTLHAIDILTQMLVGGDGDTSCSRIDACSDLPPLSDRRFPAPVVKFHR